MKFSVALYLERKTPEMQMDEVKQNLLELATLADQGGFETIWTAEHHTIELTAAPNPFTLLTWLGQHTERVRLGTATVVAPYWSPIRLAGEAALCDHLTNGRLELGIARGSYQYEFDRMAGGIQQQKGVAYLKELLPAVRKLWEGDYEHDGEFWKFPTATSVPKPLQKPHPRIWVAARDPGTFDWAISQGANILSTPLAAPNTEIAVLASKFEKAVADHPEVSRPLFMMQRRACAFDRPEDRETAIRCSVEYGRLFENLFQNIGSVTNGFPEAVPYEAIAGKDNYRPENIAQNFLFGSPDELIEKLLVYEAAGVDQVGLGINFNLPFELQRNTLKVFAKEIIPFFAARRSASRLDAAQ